jgi:hypothetical protein
MDQLDRVVEEANDEPTAENAAHDDVIIGAMNADIAVGPEAGGNKIDDAMDAENADGPDDDDDAMSVDAAVGPDADARKTLFNNLTARG